MTDAPRMFNEPYLAEALSSCTDAGASFSEDRGTFTLRFPDSVEGGPFYFAFTLDEDNEEVKVFSNIDRMVGPDNVPASDFLDGLDIIAAKLLTLFDGVDRGV